MTFLERLNHLSYDRSCPNVLISGAINFNATTWPIIQPTDADERRKLDLMTDFHCNQHILTSIDKVDVVLCNQPDPILDIKVDLQLNALYCRKEKKRIITHKSFQDTLSNNGIRNQPQLHPRFSGDWCFFLSQRRLGKT